MALWPNWQRHTAQTRNGVGSNPTGATKPWLRDPKKAK